MHDKQVQLHFVKAWHDQPCRDKLCDKLRIEAMLSNPDQASRSPVIQAFSKLQKTSNVRLQKTQKPNKSWPLLKIHHLS